MINFSINGFGRIGRSATRVWLAKHTKDLNLVAINTSGSLPVSGWAHLLKYDTAYGPLPYNISFDEKKTPDKATNEDPLLGHLIVDDFRIPILAQKDPSLIPWKDVNADIVIESTGVFRTQDQARLHLQGGAKTVIVSAPAKGGGMPTSIIGVNEDDFKRSHNTISVVSNSSCTTNCVAPVAALMHAKLGVKKAMLTTVHGYTDDQNLQDNSHKDMRRARAAAQNIIPTSTGAAVSATEAIPELKGLFDGLALRAPVVTGSISDFTFVTSQPTSVNEVNQIFTQATTHPLYKGILAVTDEPIVSSDIIGRDESAIVDLALTRVVDGDLVKVMAWYDNEWGYSNRLIEQVLQVSENLPQS